MYVVYETYVFAFSVALPLLAVAIGMIGAARAELTARQTGIFISVAGLLFGAWFAAAIPLSRLGLFNVPATLGDPPVVMVFLLLGALTIWALAWLTPLARRVTDATPLSAIAAFQIPRIMGGLFLIGWLAGDIPALFAIPAGIGDVLAGIAAWQASRALASGQANAHRLLWRANLIGIADFVLAVGLGIVTSQGFAHLYAHDTPNIINDYPLATFPAFFVPIFLGFHFIAISRMRQERYNLEARHA